MTIEKKTIRSDIPGHQSFLATSPFSGAEDARRLAVGRGITLTGVITACDLLVVEGTVETASFSARRIDILETGVFNGSADVTDAVISGSFEGSLRVSGRLVVRSTGRIKGEVSYGSMEAEAGSRIEGTVCATAIAAPKPENKIIRRADKKDDKRAPQAFVEQQALPATARDNVENLFGGDDDAGRPRVFRRAVGY